MNKHYHKTFTPIMIVLVMTLAVFSSIIYSFETRLFSYLNPVVGVATAFYYIHKGKSVIPIFFTFLTWSVVSRILMVDESIMFSIAYCLVLFVPILVMMLVFDKVQVTQFEKKLNKYNMSYVFPYILNILIVSFIGSILMFLVYHTFIGIQTEYILAFRDIFFSNFFGMFLFNMTITIIVKRDHTSFSKKTAPYFNAMFLIVFALLALIVFKRVIPGFDFEHFSFSFYFMFIVVGLLFSYKILILANFIYIFIFGGYALNGMIVLDCFTVTTEVSLFLLVANILAMTIKMMIIGYLYKSEEEQESSKTISHLVNTTNKYINEIEGLTTNSSEFFQHFLNDFFRIGCKILPKYEKSSCYYLKGNKIKYISAEGYDIDLLNRCEFNFETFSWNFDHPTLINGYADINMSSNNSKYLNQYYTRYGTIKQSLTFSLDYAGFKGGMSFDIFDYNDFLYDSKTIETFNTFHRLVMSYMKMGSLYIESSRVKNDIILSMVKTLGFYDNYTKSHSIDVSEWTNKVCDELEVDHKMKEQAYYASIVHDIGKIGISSDILNKKSRLTDAEYDLVKHHTVKGYNILSEVQNLSEIAVIVRHHHERWDGYGYPDGLEGDEIPYLSQVIGVCDSVSAMLSKRVYQDPKTIEEVIEELKAQRGKQFSPVPCDAMIKILKEKLKTK